jgi:hypothetical protein
VAFRISDERIVESSGLARDVAQQVYWTANDSGDSGVAYALTAKGTVRGSLRYRASPRDVEAVAIYGRRLYLADIGDNNRKREFVTVYFFDNPRPNDQTVSYKAYDFAYPDGPHDAETLLVDGVGRLYIVTKGPAGRGNRGAGIYAAPGLPSRQGLNHLTRLGPAPAYVTDGTFLPGDRQIALRTYVSVLMLDASTYDVVATARTPAQPQGEAITLTLNGRHLLVGSEGVGTAVFTMPVPSKVGPVPEATRTPPGSASPTPTPTPSAEPQPSEEEPTAAAAGRRGTLLAVGLAGVLAITAGVVTAVVRRR